MEKSGVSSVGLNIARYRKADGLSAAELAERSGEGLTRSIIANLENGRKSDISLRQLIAIANTLRVPPGALVVDLFNPGEPAPFDMPTMIYQDWNYETLELEEHRSRKRNSDFLAWFGAQGTFLNESELSGASLLAAEALGKLMSFDFAWRKYFNALYRYLRSTKEETDPAETKVLEDDLSAEASHVLRWARELNRSGIEKENAESIVRATMDRLRLSLDGDVQLPFHG